MLPSLINIAIFIILASGLITIGIILFVELEFYYKNNKKYIDNNKKV